MFHLEGAGRRFQIFPQTRGLRSRGHDESEEDTGFMESCEIQVQDLGPRIQHAVPSSHDGAKPRSDGDETEPEIGTSPSVKAVIKFIMRNLTSPINDIVGSDAWVNDPNMLMCKDSDRQFQLAFQFIIYIYNKINKMTVYDLYKHYVKHIKSMKYAVTGVGYHDFINSIRLVVKLILFQCNDDVNEFMTFFHNVYKVCNFTNGKKIVYFFMVHRRVEKAILCIRWVASL